MPKVVIRKTPLFDETFTKHKSRIEAKFKDFIKTKMDDPLARFGSKDTHFTGDGPLGQTGIIHAHLSHDISILYKRSGKNPTYIDLIAVVTHDELGTGQPANIKKQKTFVKKISGLTAESLGLPMGRYHATAGGYNVVVVHEGREYVFTHNVGVKGMDIPDIITIGESGVKSTLLGVSGECHIFEDAKQLPDGTYPATASGNESVVEYYGETFTFKFDNGVRGLNIKDVITVEGGVVKSNVLGVCNNDPHNV